MEQLKKYKWYISAIALVLIIAYTTATAPIEAYKLVINGKDMGYIANQSDVENLVLSLTEQASEKGLYKVEQETEITYETGLTAEDEILTSDQIKKIIENSIAFELTGYSIMIDGKAYFTLKSRSEADQIIDRVRNQYTIEDVSDLQLGFVENVVVYANPVDKNDIQSFDEVWSAFESGRQELETYKVQKGDTTWDIANRFNLTIDEIAQANIEDDLTRIQIGQVINLNIPKAWINVRAQVVTETEQPILGLTYYEKVDSMFVGEHKLKSQGEDGLKVVELETVYINGILQEEKILSEVVLKEPTSTIMLTGTKWREVAASGDFDNPLEGKLTSRFGTRWGRMHEGIDIGAAIGTPIKAADAGLVTASRYITGYGYTVILDHGKGITTLYGHASSLDVVVGQTVEKNEIIAKVGTSGSTTGPCLHFEVRRNGVAIDPLPYLNY